MSTAVQEFTAKRRRSSAEIEQHCNALRKVADNLEGDGKYEARLVRASAEAIHDACLKLNDVGFQLAKVLENGDSEV